MVHLYSIRVQTLLVFSLLSFWGCRGSANIYELDKIPSHWRNYCCGGGDSKNGELISSELALKISYDIGIMAGLQASPSNPFSDSYLWYEEKIVDGNWVGARLTSDSLLIVSFPRQMQNFYVRINEEREIDYVLDLLIRYRRDLLSINYDRGTDCYLPAKHPTPPMDAVLYYECMTSVKQQNVHLYQSRLGKAYLLTLLKEDFPVRTYEFKGGSDFQVLAKVDSIATLLQHTTYAKSGAWMRGTVIHLISDYTLREKNLEAALNYLDGQLSKYAADTLLTPNLQQERQKLIDHTQEVKEGTYMDRSKISW